MKQSLINLNKNFVRLEQGHELFGFFVLKDKDEITSNIRFINDKSNSFTRIQIKFILLDQSQIDLEATVIIEHGAFLTDTYLKIDCLILSDDAKAHIVPSMEIMEDNVKGGHGATIGMVDSNQLWYLTSRGLDQNTAENILIEGFAQSMIEQSNTPIIRNHIRMELNKLKK